MDDYRKRVENALMRNSLRLLPKPKASPRQTRNKSPEKDVQREVMAWLRQHGFSVTVIESKAVYSQSAGRYLHGQVVSGFPDVVGCTASGHAVFIELKAPGRLKTVRPAQKAYLAEKIEHGAFCVVVDGVDRLKQVYCDWVALEDPKIAMSYLMELLL